MSSRAPARTLLAIAASAAVLAGSLLAPSVASAASTPPPDGESVQLTPELRLDPTGANPCVGASEAAMAAIHCVGRLLDPAPVPVLGDLIPPLVSSDIKPNCTPGVISPASPSAGVSVTVTGARTSSTTKEENGSTWDSVGVSLSSETDMLFSKRTVTVSYSHTWVSGWSESWTEALQTSHSVSYSYEKKIPAYHWAVSKFTPFYDQVRVLWTWDEPELIAQRAGVRAGAVDTLYLPRMKNGAPDGTWDVDTVPMNPAEILACATTDGPVAPTPVNAQFVGPSQARYLDEMPTMYATGPLTAPVLTSGAGTASSFKPRAALVKSRIPGTSIEYDYLDHSLQLTGNSEVAFWTAGQCTALTARVGYGQNLKIEAPGIARDALEVWSGRITGGRVEPVKLLSSTLVPLAPAQGIYGADTYQARIAADTTSAEVLILKTIRGAGTSDPLSSQDPGVVIGDPHIECSGTGQTVLRSKYVDPITTYDLHLAGTPEQIAANPTEYRAPNLVENGWQCNNQPESLKPLTTVGQSCGGNPLRINGQEYAVGIGAHSGSVDNGAGVHSAAKIRWEHLPPTCTTLSFGVGFDDEVPADWRMNHTITVKSLLYDAPTESTVEPRVIDSIYLNGDGRDGIKQVTLDTVGLGSRMIEIDMDVAYNGNGHVDVVNPVLSCRAQGATVSSYTPKPAPGGIIEVPVSSMTPTRTANFWGPVEVDMSNGDSAAYDGRSIAPKSGAAFSIGGITKWASGFGVHPGSGEHAQIDVPTRQVCQRITTWVGVDDESGGNGSVRFTIYADGKQVAQSGVVSGGQKPQFLSADITGSHTVTLSVDDGGDNTYNDHADWGEPTLLCSADPVQERSIALTTLRPFDVQNYWGPVEVNTSLGEEAGGDGSPIRIGSFTGFATGLGMAPGDIGEPARASYTVPEGCTEFTTWVGVDREVGAHGSVYFIVWNNRMPGATSATKYGGEDPEFLTVKVVPGETLTLWATNGFDGNGWDHADWGDPRFLCGG